MNSIKIKLLESELVFSTSRSSGPGGQNVNKVNSRVTLKFDVPNSSILNEDERDIILKKLATHLTKDGVLMFSVQDDRSQLQNKELAIEKFRTLIKKAFEKKKIRRATKPSKGAVQKRIVNKKQQGEKKKWRQKM